MRHAAINKDTFSTPALSAATALSTFGIIPLSMMPARFEPIHFLDLKVGNERQGSLGSRSSPGTSLMKTSRLALSAMAAWAAATSALQL